MGIIFYQLSPASPTAPLYTDIRLTSDISVGEALVPLSDGTNSFVIAGQAGDDYYFHGDIYVGTSRADTDLQLQLSGPSDAICSWSLHAPEEHSSDFGLINEPLIVALPNGPPDGMSVFFMGSVQFVTAGSATFQIANAVGSQTQVMRANSFLSYRLSNQ